MKTVITLLLLLSGFIGHAQYYTVLYYDVPDSQALHVYVSVEYVPIDTVDVPIVNGHLPSVYHSNDTILAIIRKVETGKLHFTLMYWKVYPRQQIIGDPVVFDYTMDASLEKELDVKFTEQGDLNFSFKEASDLRHLQYPWIT